MAERAGFFFFPADWRADPALAMVSEGARLLWFEMLCIMAESEEFGFLRVKGRTPTPAQIATLTRTDTNAIESRLAELEDFSVFSRDKRGVIYSRKMVRDEKKRRKARENGKKGGNPSLSKTSENPPSDNQPDNPPDKLNTLNSTSKEDSDSSLRSESLPTDVGRKPPAPSKLKRVGRNKQYPDEFERAWLAYPTREGEAKNDCYVLWRKAVLEGVPPDEIERGAIAWGVAAGNEYLIGMRRWLRNGNWSTPPPRQSQSPPRHRRQGYAENIAETAELMQELQADDTEFERRALH